MSTQITKYGVRLERVGDDGWYHVRFIERADGEVWVKAEDVLGWLKLNTQADGAALFAFWEREVHAVKDGAR